MLLRCPRARPVDTTIRAHRPGRSKRRAAPVRCGTSLRCAFTALYLSQLIDGPTKGTGLLAFVRFLRTGKWIAFTSETSRFSS